jgi:hypothetical protein
VGARQLEAGDREPPAHAARANDELVSLKTQPGLGDDGVRIDEARSAGMLVDDHSQRINLLPQGRMRTHIVDDLAHTRKQSRIVQHRLSHGYAVLTELARLAHQPAGMGKRPHRNRSVVGCHAAEFGAGYERGARTQLRSTEGGEHTRRASANNDDVWHPRFPPFIRRPPVGASPLAQAAPVGRLATS